MSYIVKYFHLRIILKTFTEEMKISLMIFIIIHSNVTNTPKKKQFGG